MSESYKYPEEKRFKFRELKVYASTEWLADNKKKYRQVFDRFESTYIYAELSFYNKQFDKEDWEVDVELKCYRLKKGREEICSLSFESRKISKYDNLVYIREGWGNKSEGQFWKKGTYYWEAWIEGEKVATKYFYVEDAGKTVAEGDNSYLEVKSLKLYEGPYDDVNKDDRMYFKKFSSEETRYIYVEILLKNKYPAKSWQCELFTKFYNDARELKGQVVRLHRVEKKDEHIKITAGWGSNVKGSWRKDRYTAELVFMDKLLAVIPFEVGEAFEEGIAGVLLPDRHSPIVLSPEEDMNQTFEEVMEKMDDLIGLTYIKQKVRDHANYIKFLQLRKDKGFEEKEKINVHSVFIGNPGTGKTTVAGMMGKLYHKMGLLSKGHVLFIDEAYALARSNDDSKDFGREVIEILMKEMSNGPGDMAVIVAGYPKEMKHFLDSNPGLKSRFKLNFEFDDYLPQELSKIARYSAFLKGVKFTNDGWKKIDDIIIDAFRTRDRTFGNARFVFDMIEQAKIQLGLRVMQAEDPNALEKEEMEIIHMPDVEKIKLSSKRPLPQIPVDESLLEDSLAELETLIGMDNIKVQIRELVELVRYYRLIGKDVLNNFFLHTVFFGNPGTGKTTVARILTKIYKALGVLERGHMIETDRQGLVAGYVGQTAIKTAEKIDEATGGVLFIDEAYALTQSGRPGAHGDFGNEAIQTLLKRMEDDRGQFFVFVAGYTDNMETFLKANPGLSSRFDKLLKFEDYKPSEMMQIAELMFNQEQFRLSTEATKHLNSYFEFIYEYRDKYFGNARTVRSVVADTIKIQNLRLAALSAADREEHDLNLIGIEDVEKFKLDKDGFLFNKKTIGFRNGGK